MMDMDFKEREELLEDSAKYKSDRHISYKIMCDQIAYIDVPNYMPMLFNDTDCTDH